MVFALQKHSSCSIRGVAPSFNASAVGYTATEKGRDPPLIGRGISSFRYKREMVLDVSYL